MGRYYNGDINGKFGFGSQPSSDGEYFGAEGLEANVIDYCIDNKDIPEALEKLQKLILRYRKETGNTTLTKYSTTDEFWDTVDQDWYQDSKNGLLCGRIHMGLEIAKFHRENPDSPIYFEAEL
jgi:hypothetical protein